MFSRSAFAMGLFIWAATGQSFGANPSTGLAGDDPKTWTDSRGRTIRASLLTIEDEYVLLERHDGKRGAVAKNRLSALDRQFVVQRDQKVAASLTCRASTRPGDANP